MGERLPNGDMGETFRNLAGRRESLVGGFLLGVVLIPVGMVIFGAGHTVMKCTDGGGLPGIVNVWRRGQLILTDGCNYYEAPYLSIFGVGLVALTVGYVVVGRIR